MVHRVTRDEFYSCIGEMNVTARPRGVFPYRTDFCLKSGERVGYIQDIDVTGGENGSSYYLEASVAM